MAFITINFFRQTKTRDRNSFMKTTNRGCAQTRQIPRKFYFYFVNEYNYTAYSHYLEFYKILIILNAKPELINNFEGWKWAVL